MAGKTGSVMAGRTRRPPLTELEACALGAIWLRGPCSAYAIRREFAESNSSYWSASSGSIYPVIKRLLALGLVSARASPSDMRGTRDLVATAKGARALRAWVRDLPNWTRKPSLDPVRSRMNFLAVLGTRAAQLDFVKRAIAGARAQDEDLRRELPSFRKTSDTEYLTNLGSLYEVEARMRWLEAVGKAIRAGAAIR
jgi:DNA-binding PadR family transcriptional regulator